MHHNLFTLGNPKTAKGEALGWLTAVLHLAPAESSGVANVCPQASPGCTALCLNTAGRSGIGLTTTGDNVIQAARRRRTREYVEDPQRFAAKLAEEVWHHYRSAQRRGLKLAVRINGTSDLPALARAVARLTPEGPRFYDYTKVYGVWTQRPRIHYTFSRSENNLLQCSSALSFSVNVAVVFGTRKGEDLPKRWVIQDRVYPVIDGDEHDLRFLDQYGGVIVGLRAKGRARKDTGNGFVVQVGA